MRICDGCNVRGTWEHRCHGEKAVVMGEQTNLPCECPECRKEATMNVRKLMNKLDFNLRLILHSDGDYHYYHDSTRHKPYAVRMREEIIKSLKEAGIEPDAELEKQWGL